MRKIRKPEWVRTRTPWEAKLFIWKKAARGYAIKDIVAQMQTSEESRKHGNWVWDRDTISKVIDELIDLLDSLLPDLEGRKDIRDFRERVRARRKQPVGFEAADSGRTASDNEEPNRSEEGGGVTLLRPEGGEAQVESIASGALMAPYFSYAL